MPNWRSIFVAVLLMVPLSVGAVGLVNINTAGVTELDALPGIGPAKAQAIVAYRTEHGPFVRTEDLVLVKGIGPSTYEGLKDLVTISSVSSAVSKPSAPTAGSYKKPVETGGTITNTSNRSYAEDALGAPTAPAPLAAVGAAAAAPTGASLTDSPWTLGFLALLLVAGGVLLIL